MKRVLFWLLLITLTLMTCEGVVRLALTPPGYFPLDPKEDPLYATHPVLGYTLEPNTHADYVTPEIDIDIDIGPDGLRDSSLGVIHAADYRILAVGNSFTMGLGVANEDTWGKQLERGLAAARPERSVHVANAGVPGFSPRQIRLRLGMLLPAIDPQLVIFGLTVETYTRMQVPIRLFGGTLVRSDAIDRFRLTERGLVYSPLERPWMRAVDQWLNRYWQMGAHGLHLAYVGYGWFRRAVLGDRHETATALDPRAVEEAMAPTLTELTRARDLAQAYGADFVVLLINLQDPDGSFGTRQTLYNRIVREHCERAGMVCVDPLPILERHAGGRLRYRTRDDQHWTPAAHAVAADALRQSVVPLRIGGELPVRAAAAR